MLLIQVLPGIGDDALICTLSRYLMCQKPERYESCGQRCGCQLVQAGARPDYYLLFPEKNKSTLGIDAVRKVSKKLYEHLRLGGAKAAQTPDAVRLTDTAANALLKTLGEPPAQTWFFLISTEPARLLAILCSHRRLHHLAPPPESYAISWLARGMAASSEALLSVLRLSAGSPDAALTLLQAESWMHRTDFCATLANILSAGDWYVLLTALNHDQAAVRLHRLVMLLTDALKRPHGISHLANPDVLDLISSITERLSVTQIQAILGDVCHCRQQLLNITGVNRKLVSTDLIFHIEHCLQPSTVLPVLHP